MPKTTSLSRQLNNLAERPAASVVAENPSLLFSTSEAAKIDNDTIYKLGLEGLQDLVKHDGRFASFLNSLFSEEANRINRESRNMEYNKYLNELISKLLLLLSPYFLLNAAHQVLEYMIRHYKYVKFIFK